MNASTRRPVVAGITAGLLALSLAACEPANEPATIPSECAGSENLLQNPGFSDGANPALPPWKTAQHAGPASFNTRVEDGVVTIERHGGEPWYTISQLPPVEGIQGHDLWFQVDLKLNLHGSDWAYPSMPPGGGLIVAIWGPTIPVVGGSRQVFSSVIENEPSLGQVDWFTASLRLRVPDDASRLSVGVMQRAAGSLSLRDPLLLDCGPSAVDEAP